MKMQLLRFGFLMSMAGGCLVPSIPPDGASTTKAPAHRGKFGTVPGTALLGPQGASAFELHGDTQKVALGKVTVQGQAFTDAVRVEIKEGSGSDWSVQMQTPTIAPVQKGDAVLATFWIRAASLQEDGGAETQFVFEMSKEPYSKSISYPLQVGPNWREVKARFVANDDYQAGQAQMIFRLGYDPETIEIGGVTVESFGKQLALLDLPSTEAADKRRTTPVVEATTQPPIQGGELKVTVTPSKMIGHISPYVYGVNSQPVNGMNVTVRRMGGNRQTVYNWELNASNAGSDYHHVNDEWPCTVLGYKDCSEPGAQMADFVASNKQAGMESIVTVPMVDYVSADKKGEVHENEAAPSTRFNRSVAHKDGPYSLEPDKNDGVVYEDEFVNFLVHKFGKAKDGGAKFYSLDNEPALWAKTHPRIHPAAPTYQEIMTRTEAIAAPLTQIDPSATVLGGVMYGWGEYMSLDSAPDSKELTPKYGDSYLDFYLASVKALEQKYKRRLVHALDIHWYPEVKGTKRITENDASRKTVDARLSAPRSLWDPTFVEKSWIGDSLKKPIRLIPWLLEKIAKQYPGTKLTMTEYNFGAPNHISGGLAQVDVLGIFGREGLYMANYWGDGPGNETLKPFIAAAFKIYRNYDGKGASFGDTAVTASVDNLDKASVYAATDSAHPNLLTVLVINKDQRTIFSGKLGIEGTVKYQKAQPYLLDAASADVRPQPTIDIKDTRIAYSLAPLTATLFVCEKRP
jgi:hypothetical protein